MIDSALNNNNETITLDYEVLYYVNDYLLRPHNNYQF